MAQGTPTPLETVERFRAHYLYSGNASESARKVGIPESTGRDIAQALVDDPSFVEARRRLRESALQELVAMRGRVARLAMKRFKSKTGGIDVKSFGGGEQSTTVITDKRHEYGKLVLDAEKNAHNLAKVSTEEKPGAKGGVTIIVRPTAEAQVVLDEPDDGSPSGES